MNIKGIFVILVTSLLILSGCSSKHKKLTKRLFDDLNEKWPLKVSEVEIECDWVGDVQVPYVISNGIKYHIIGLGSNRGSSIDPIWADNPKIKGTKISIGDFIEEAKNICER